MKYLIKHWKTTVTGLLIALLTVLLSLGRITVLEWAEGLGVIGTVIALLSKDWDKTNDTDSKT